MENYLHTATILANILDNHFDFFGIRLGFNTILDLIPEFGNIIATILSLYIIWLAIRMRVPALKVGRMALNVLVNMMIGWIPFLGSLAYIVNKANIKNVEILKNHIKENPLRLNSTILS